MEKNRYTEEQTAFALKQTETDTRVGKSAERWGFLRPLFITRRRNLLVWA